MGLLRAFCLISVIMAVVIGGSAYVSSVPIFALAPLCFGVLALIVVLPFPAYERVGRSRVMVACIFYTAATALSCGIANVRDPSDVTLLMSLPPLTGAMLSAWAFKTRSRRRRIGFSNYYDA